MKTSHDQLISLRKQIEGDEQQGGKVPGLRKEVRTAQQDRDRYALEATRLTNQWNEAADELRRLKDRQRTLAADLAKAKQVLQKFSLKAEPDLYAETPLPVDGVVRAVTRGGLVEINIGSDDGLLEGQGHKLEVYRVAGGRTTYVGRIEVVKTDPDKAVCKILPEYRQSNVLEGDRVASRINY